MARYQLRRPSPVQVFPQHVRRQAATVGTESPKSPESPDGEDSESEDEAEPPSPKQSGASASTTKALDIISTTKLLDATSTAAQALPTSQAVTSTRATDPTSTSVTSSVASSISTSSILSTITITTTIPTQPASTVGLSSGSNNNATRSVTDYLSLTSTRAVKSSSQIVVIQSSSTLAVTSFVTSSSMVALPPAQSDTAGEASVLPRPFSQREQHPILTKSAAIAATVLGALGVLALLIGAIIFMKHRKRKRSNYHQRLADDAFSPSNTGSLRAPETAHLNSNPGIFNQGGGGVGAASHLTRLTNRSDTLFGPGTYARPETVSTTRNAGRFPIALPQPTPNPFADPPLNKAYDVLGGRPRSTTLTDRGSWIKNPFRNPESERFDPFGELQNKARMERVRHVVEAKHEREREVVRGFEEKERMGLMPEGAMARKGSEISGVTLEGIGVLDRSGGSAYR